MKKLSILSLTLFLSCGLGSGCMASPQLLGQSSPKTPSSGKRSTPVTKTPKPSPFVSGVSLPVFPGTTPSATSAPGVSTPETAAPVLPLVEVPTPGLRSSKGKRSSNQPAPPIKQRKKVVEETSTPVRKRSKGQGN